MRGKRSGALLLAVLALCVASRPASSDQGTAPPYDYGHGSGDAYTGVVTVSIGGSGASSGTHQESAVGIRRVMGPGPFSAAARFTGARAVVEGSRVNVCLRVIGGGTQEFCDALSSALGASGSGSIEMQTTLMTGGMHQLEVSFQAITPRSATGAAHATVRVEQISFHYEAPAPSNTGNGQRPA